MKVLAAYTPAPSPPEKVLLNVSCSFWIHNYFSLLAHLLYSKSTVQIFKSLKSTLHVYV